MYYCLLFAAETERRNNKTPVVSYAMPCHLRVANIILLVHTGYINIYLVYWYDMAISYKQYSGRYRTPALLYTQHTTHTQLEETPRNVKDKKYSEYISYHDEVYSEYMISGTTFSQTTGCKQQLVVQQYSCRWRLMKQNDGTCTHTCTYIFGSAGSGRSPLHRHCRHEPHRVRLLLILYGVVAKETLLSASGKLRLKKIRIKAIGTYIKRGCVGAPTHHPRGWQAHPRAWRAHPGRGRHILEEGK